MLFVSFFYHFFFYHYYSKTGRTPPTRSSLKKMIDHQVCATKIKLSKVLWAINKLVFPWSALPGHDANKQNWRAILSAHGPLSERRIALSLFCSSSSSSLSAAVLFLLPGFFLFEYSHWPPFFLWQREQQGLILSHLTCTRIEHNIMTRLMTKEKGTTRKQ